MSDLRTDYKDDVLDTSQNVNRKFNIVDSNGNILYQDVSLEETTEFLQQGDSHSASVVNEQNQKINEINTQLSNIPSMVVVNTTIGTTTTNVSFPTGYTDSNCYIDGGMVDLSSSSTGNYQMIDSANTVRITFYNGQIQVNPVNATVHNKPLKIVLRKYPS